jgi:hypothetical protein
LDISTVKVEKQSTVFATVEGVEGNCTEVTAASK